MGSCFFRRLFLRVVTICCLTCVSLQRIRATVNSQEQKRLLMDLDVSMRTVDCPFTVTFYGALFREVSDPSGQCPRNNSVRASGRIASLLAARWAALWKLYLLLKDFKAWGETIPFFQKLKQETRVLWEKIVGYLFFFFPFPSSLTILGLIGLQGDVWICMELMDTSLDKFYKQVIDKGQTIPEDILGKIAVSVSISWTPPT